jgi:predicted MPP superfamily phosphohydrolase
MRSLPAVWARLGLLAGLASLLGWLYARHIERRRVRLDRFVITVDRPRLPAKGLVILHLSDLHFGADSRIEADKVANLQRLLAGEHYDLVFFTGDLIHTIHGLPAALAFLQTLHPSSGTFCCLGNHDYAEYSVWSMFDNSRDLSSEQGNPGNSLARLARAARQMAEFVRKVVRNELVRLPVAYNDITAIQTALAQAGVQPLVNQAFHLQGDDLDLWIAGVDDHTEGRPDLAAALAPVPNDALLILLAHNPDIWLDPGIERADLVLAGHTHGGQIRLPLIGAIHTQGTHLTRRCPAGWFQRGQARMFVSQGLGESVPLRLGVLPQAALIHLVPAREAGLNPRAENKAPAGAGRAERCSASAGP